MITQNAEPRTSFTAVVVALLVAAGAALAAALLPLSEYGDANLFDGGTLHTALVVAPVVLMVLAAIAVSSAPSMAGLGGGAALALGSVFGSVSIAIWNSTDGEGLGAGASMMMVSTIVCIATAAVAFGKLPSGQRNVAHILAFVAVVVMCGGVTLVPDEAAGVSWSDWNHFSDGVDGLFTLSVHLLVWTPLVVALLGLVKGGRGGAWFGLAGSVALGWAVADTTLADPYTAEFRTAIHPMAAVGGAAAVGLYIVALATSASRSSVLVAGPSTTSTSPSPAGAAVSAHPARWADDPFGRHTHRYWSGTEWTEQVADNGLPSIDPPVAASVAAPANAPTSAPTTESVFTAQPVEFAAVGARDVPAPPIVDAEATVPRSAVVHQAVTCELILDTGQRVVLVGPVIIGRAPRPQPEEPTATLLPIADQTMSVSATHLLVGLRSDGAWVQDVGSTNGSSIVDSAGRVTSLLEGVRVPVAPGSTIHFGDRTALVASTSGGVANR